MDVSLLAGHGGDDPRHFAGASVGKPATGWFSLDVRSRDRDLLESIGGQVPGARDTLLTRAAVAAARFLSYEPIVSDLGCCTMRVAIGGHTLATSIHCGRGGRGGDRGTATEWASIPSLLNTARQSSCCPPPTLES
ncbi:MAG: hypothetical protein ACKVZ0_19435 [Gemmatimonadales bacterium]